MNEYILSTNFIYQHIRNRRTLL